MSQKEYPPLPRQLRELDDLYRVAEPVAYELAYLRTIVRIEREYPGFTLAYAEIRYSGPERFSHGNFRHVLTPKEWSAD